MITVRISVDGVTSDIEITEQHRQAINGDAQAWCDQIQKTALLAVARAQAAIKAEQQLYGRQAV